MTDQSPARRTPALLTAALGLLLVALVAVAAFLAWRYTHFDDGPSRVARGTEAYVSTEERAAALQVAEQYSLRMDAIDGADPDGYAKRVKQLLTTKGATSFDKQWAALQQLGMDKKTQGKGEVLASAVSDIDPDSATVMVAHDAVITTGSGTTGRHYRWTIELEKVRGTWLVDAFTQAD